MNKDYCLMQTKGEEKRKGGSILTYTGKLFWPLDARVNEVNIEDIAHSLSNMCRFAGHINEFYSVAQHCVMVSDLLANRVINLFGSTVQDKTTAYLRKVGLTHDASEAYLVDIPRPIKRSLPNYVKIEHKLQFVIAKAFGVNYNKTQTDYDSTWLKAADNEALAIEAHNLVNDPLKLWTVEAQLGFKTRIKIKPLMPKVAEKLFLKRYYSIIAEDF
jgi:hypothetical protein